MTHLHNVRVMMGFDLRFGRRWLCWRLAHRGSKKTVVRFRIAELERGDDKALRSLTGKVLNMIVPSFLPPLGSASSLVISFLYLTPQVDERSIQEIVSDLLEKAAKEKKSSSLWFQI